MIAKLTLFAIGLLLVGCQSAKPIVDIQYVDKPIVIIPKPPEVPKFEYYVDKLTDRDISNPGNVGYAYVHDLTIARQLEVIFREIIDQYTKSSVNFDQVNEKINQLVNKTN